MSERRSARDSCETLWLHQAREAIAHPYFREKPLPQEAAMMPTFPSLHSDMPDRRRVAAPAQAMHHQQQQRFGNAFSTMSSSAAVASALKKRRV